MINNSCKVVECEYGRMSFELYGIFIIKIAETYTFIKNVLDSSVGVSDIDELNKLISKRVSDSQLSASIKVEEITVDKVFKEFTVKVFDMVSIEDALDTTLKVGYTIFSDEEFEDNYFNDLVYDILLKLHD